MNYLILGIFVGLVVVVGIWYLWSRRSTSNGTTSNGTTSNGTTSNGTASNGTTSNGTTSNGDISPPPVLPSPPLPPSPTCDVTNCNYTMLNKILNNIPFDTTNIDLCKNCPQRYFQVLPGAIPGGADGGTMWKASVGNDWYQCWPYGGEGGDCYSTMALANP